MRNCLDYYAKASRQSITFNKSSLSLSPNTLLDDRDAICGLFGISQVTGHDIYLGLPTFSMKNMCIQFGHIRDMVVRKPRGWKEKVFFFFSQGGKEVLIKAAIQAIPTYAMSCFMIPYIIIRDIEAACARFWWGST